MLAIAWPVRRIGSARTAPRWLPAVVASWTSVRGSSDCAACCTPTLLLEREGLTVVDVRCNHRAGRGSRRRSRAEATPSCSCAGGASAAAADGVEALLDPTVAYTVRPGEEERYDHPYDQGDDCTSIGLRAGSARDGCVATSRICRVARFAHRRGQQISSTGCFVSALRRGDDEHAVLRACVGHRRSRPRGLPPSVGSWPGRPATERARRILVRRRARGTRRRSRTITARARSFTRRLPASPEPASSSRRPARRSRATGCACA